jgi:hypothetical protein
MAAGAGGDRGRSPVISFKIYWNNCRECNYKAYLHSELNFEAYD